jgi:iron complex outermembrane recepter protein
VLFSAFSICAEESAHTQRYDINIPRLNAVEALNLLADQTDAVMFFSYQIAKDKQASPVKGYYTLKESLHIMLKDSGLSGGLSYDGFIEISLSGETVGKGEEKTVNKNKLNKTKIRASFFSAMSAAILSVFSADTATAQNNDEDSNGLMLEEVTVTASRREEALQNVGMSVTSVKPEAFTDAGLTRLADVIAYTNGINVSNAKGNPVGANITIRGVGQQIGTATAGVYVDAIPTTSNSPWGNAGSFAFDGMLGDVERVEFLKGPQGTLYGSTSIGGAIKYITRKPSLNELNGTAAIDFSNTKEGDDNVIYNGRISTPLVEDKLGITFAGFFEDNGGLVDRVNATTADLENADSYERYGVSGDLYFVYSDELDFRARVLHQKADFDGLSTVNIDPVTRKPAQGSLSNDRPFSPSYFENTLYSVTAEYHFAEATLTATSSYVEEQSYGKEDLANGGFGAFIDSLLGNAPGTTTSVPNVIDVGSEKFTQEIQLTSDSSEDWEWMIGLYYADEDTFFNNSIIAEPSGLDAGSEVSPSGYQEYAAFGNVTYYVTPDFDLTLGTRVSHSTVTRDALTTSDLEVFPGPASNEIKDTVDTWSFTARYRPAEEHSLYTRIASGYRPAAANSPLSRLPSVIESDSLWNYELGSKGILADSLFSYDIALWYLDWDNYQTNLVTPFGTGLGNARGGITAKGLEGSFTITPAPGLSIISNFAYTKSTLNDDEIELSGLEGQQLPFVPEWTLSSRVNYSFSLTANLDASVGIGVRYEDSSRSAFTDATSFIPGESPVGGTYNTLFNIPTDSHTEVDLNSAITWDKSTLGFYVTNLLNEEAITGTFGQHAFGSVFQSRGVPLRPRTIGLRYSLNY